MAAAGSYFGAAAVAGKRRVRLTIAGDRQTCRSNP